jgi:protein tyrosine phosphatase
VYSVDIAIERRENKIIALLFIRYTNILPYDHSRVHLQAATTESGHYINANWIAETGCNRCIAAQGPLPQTVSHFLQMVHENKVAVIIALTKLEEKDSEGNWP